MSDADAEKLDEQELLDEEFPDDHPYREGDADPIDQYVGDWLDQQNEQAAENMTPASKRQEQIEKLDAIQSFPELAADSTDAPRTLRDILFTHRALAAAKALEITELMAELQLHLVDRAARDVYATDGLDLVVKDARQQRDNARAQDKLFSRPGWNGYGHYETAWRKANPGLVALLQAVDGD